MGVMTYVLESEKYIAIHSILIPYSIYILLFARLASVALKDKNCYYNRSHPMYYGGRWCNDAYFLIGKESSLTRDVLLLVIRHFTKCLLIVIVIFMTNYVV